MNAEKMKDRGINAILAIAAGLTTSLILFAFNTPIKVKEDIEKKIESKVDKDTYQKDKDQNYKEHDAIKQNVKDSKEDIKDILELIQKNNDDYKKYSDKQFEDIKQLIRAKK